MHYFDTYKSNTLAGSGNQSWFCPEDENKIMRGRTYYKVYAGGTYDYSILFSNCIDSTFADGAHSHCNLIVDCWRIAQAYIGISRGCSMREAGQPYEMHPLLFDKKEEKQVAPGEFWCSDPVTLSPQAGEYICLEVAFSGRMIPHHEESTIPGFVLTDGKWIPSKRRVVASMVGCSRPTEARIAFLGDSITQGIGTPPNSYSHWNAVLADILGDRYAYWNLGLGFGRANDAASDGAWLFKAKQNDTVVVCYGVNDILQGFGAAEVKRDLERIVDLLHKSGCRVVLQTVPPFDYNAERAAVWHEVNDFIRNTLSQKAELVFDCVPYLQKSDAEPQLARYGGHPNEAGCAVWGKALAAELTVWQQRAGSDEML